MDAWGGGMAALLPAAPLSLLLLERSRAACGGGHQSADVQGHSEKQGRRMVEEPAKQRCEPYQGDLPESIFFEPTKKKSGWKSKKNV